MKNIQICLKHALPVAAFAGLLAIGAAPLAAGLQQPPVTQPPAPAAQQPPSAPQPVPRVQSPAQVPQPTPDPAAPAPPSTQTPAPVTGQTAQTPATNAATPSGGAVVLLDRISDLVDQALGEKKAGKASDKGTPGAKGTTGVMKVGKTSAGSVSVERATLDEIKAEVEQLRIMLKDKQP